MQKIVLHGHPAYGSGAMEIFFLAALVRASGVGSGQIQKLLDEFERAETVWRLSREELLSANSVPGHVIEAIDRYRRECPDAPAQLQETCQQKGIQVICMQSPEYPDRLKQIFDPPVVLFYRGKLQPDAERLAMVGSRLLSHYGEGVAADFAEELARAGFTIVSGGARGIDTFSHVGALRTGRTVAVLGCGVDFAYPPENRRLFDKIAEKGALLSEYGPGTKPFPAFFPARNRIISGLSRGVLVVEAAERSGSLITAELAVNEGRDVFAIPGNIYSKTSKGCHRLIQQGAKLVSCVEDILEEYGTERRTKPTEPKKRLPELTPEEGAVYHVLSAEHALSMDEIIYSLHGAPVSNVAFLLLQLELKGYVRENEMHAYLRAERE